MTEDEQKRSGLGHQKQTGQGIQSPVVKAFLAGSISGTLSTLTLQPLDFIKTRIQSSKSSPERKIRLIITGTCRDNGFFGLWKGLTPSLARTVPGVGLYFCCLYNLQDKLQWSPPSAIQAVVIAAASRSFAGVVLLPITVIKTRFESKLYEYRTVSGAIREIYITEGFRGLFSGMSATLLRDAPFSGIYFMFYSQSKIWLPQESVPATLNTTLNFCRGLISGILAAVLTQPFDTTKTHMQLSPLKHDTFHRTVQYIIHNDGMRGLYAGMLPRCLRRSLMSALSWTVYEELKTRLDLR